MRFARHHAARLVGLHAVALYSVTAQASFNRWECSFCDLALGLFMAGVAGIVAIPISVLLLWAITRVFHHPEKPKAALWLVVVHAVIAYGIAITLVLNKVELPYWLCAYLAYVAVVACYLRWVPPSGATRRANVLRLSEGAKRDPAVESWLTDTADLRSIAQKWFTRMRQCGGDVRELMHDGCPVACVIDAPFAYVSSFDGYIDVGFYYGAFLEDPAGLMEGNDNRLRHVKVIPGRELNAEALGDLIDAAYVDIKARLLGLG